MPILFWLRLAAMTCGACAWLAGQGLATKASRDDWEDINFAFNSAVVSDGYPSLLRLAELLVQNRGYTVKLLGHTDSLGPSSVNNALSRARAEAVKAFLISRGVQPAQVQPAGRGSQEPVASNATREGRFMNRRVKVTVYDQNGREVGASHLGARLRPVSRQEPPGPPTTRKVQPVGWIPDGGVHGCFGVQIGAFWNRANAERLKELVTRSSARAEIRPSSTIPPFWKVIAGCEHTRTGAHELARRLGGNFENAFIVSLNGADAREQPGSAKNPEEQ